MKCRLVAIAKNERRYLSEWIGYHLGIGFSSIVIYDNESEDGTRELINLLKFGLPIEYIFWPSIDRASPQRSAYNHALDSASNDDFVFFIDIDEFIVPWGHSGIIEFAQRIPQDVSSVVVNWRCFGSSGRKDPNYKYVIKTFFKCAPDIAPNNKHVKTLARPSAIREMFIHHAQIQYGRTVASDLTDAIFDTEGKTNAPKYSGIQINHYQTKTLTEFIDRMARGNANFPKSHPSHKRDCSIDRFRQLDINTHHDDKITQFFPQFDKMMNKIDILLS